MTESLSSDGQFTEIFTLNMPLLIMQDSIEPDLKDARQPTGNPGSLCVPPWVNEENI